MKFYIVSKDYKESWYNYFNIFNWCTKNGLKQIQEISGDELGIDSTYMVFAEKDINYDLCRSLIQISEFDLETFNDEGSEDNLISSFEEINEKKYNKYVITLKTGDIYELIYPSDWNNL